MSGYENADEDLLARQGVADKDDIEHDPENPYIARAVPTKEGAAIDETAGTGSPAGASKSYPDIVEGSDSERTGTSWGLPGVENAPK